jgi:hypothetical protein
MKKIVLFLLFAMTSVLNASWQEDWSNAVECCSNQDYVNAEANFTLAIDQLESEGNEIHPHVYVDRGRLYSLLGRNEEALRDLDIARTSPILQGDDKLRAVVSRLVTYYRLNMIEESKSELEVFKSIYSCPKLEVYKDTVIIRNVPDCECSHEILKNFVSSFCESPDDVKITNGICIGKRKKCDCGCDKSNQAMMLSKSSIQSPQMNVSDCKWYCDKMQVSGNIFCAGAFKFFRCQAICIATVEVIKDGCYWCCNSGNFYKKCIKPFEDIVGRMGQGCDQMWD